MLPVGSFLYPHLFKPMLPLRAFAPLPFRKGAWKDALTNTKVFPAYWSALVLVILIGDYVSGPTIQFPILYLIPVALASWYNGKWWGLGFAVVMPIIRLYFHVAVWTIYMEIFDSVLNAMIRMTVLAAFAFLIDRTAWQTRKLSQKVRVLEGILPVCSFCKKIRDQQGHWRSMEQFITERSEAQFSHGFCPECGERHYGDILKRADGPAQKP
jgi:K+-sensing histidine kinase KdpD